MEGSNASKEQTAAQFYSDEKHIEMWRIKRLIKKLDNTKGYVSHFNKISFFCFEFANNVILEMEPHSSQCTFPQKKT